MSASFDVDGFESLMSKLQSMGKEGTKIEDEALQKAAEPILVDAKNSAPVRTGKLRDGLKISKAKKSKDGKYVLVGTDKKDKDAPFWATFIEFGTSKMPAQPFLRPAFEKNKKQVFEIIKEEIAKKVE
ncbi:phage protein, HK97 gp10 family [Clostridium pasteurianum DSM 525 = ATCC 6013]|uniref:Phage protein, HK97 gp10 family n=1 Tax=Clostridium pasteurianum DSM 525 = ATCC 6013 TaxID=1262449 RepID=A0A0H3J694_CLOPA|nr:HK97-gp10 family putative phage morphogenesis protein [Clostridium pasteurianum]AJA49531.1 phage protein, HK97 gp10 family [Clostridium pasteurianum DSM 525 = ATCC 6013]AJA53519.1 phage protein, HK97 gp10 family [Clostridium pasteurianum DSM 525 = ATCC 6013]AOZ76690.1 hypothetical protein AQ983_16855 [Clostridium pasteurianum DSM 525 = ATCC 6013]AOZ80487.1 hypothetical protein AQ984_16850 [Clostridium pasteurianum]ELP58951.1 phage protein, HK97 gp10 family [Clostridium pasteurianum DSM 525 